MRFHPRRFAPFLLLGFSIIAPAFVRAGWNPGGVTVVSATGHLRPLAACDDGAGGTFVMWQRFLSYDQIGELRAQHLLMTGEVDPAWPTAGATVCGVSATRERLGVVSDGLGGFFAWWTEGQTFYVTRIGCDGLVAPGWMVRGRALGVMPAYLDEPAVLGDGAHGFYAAWADSDGMGGDPYQLRLSRLGVDGSGASGWPTSGVITVPYRRYVVTAESSPSLALCPDGGVFVAWNTWTENRFAVPGGIHLVRFAPDGTTSAGWDSTGILVREFDLSLYTLQAYMESEWDRAACRTRNVSVARDLDGGVYVYSWKPGFMEFADAQQALVDHRLSDGSLAPGWPASGVSTPWATMMFGPDMGPRAVADGFGNLYAGSPVLFTDSPPYARYEFMGPSGVVGYPRWFDVVLPGEELAADGGGGIFIASFSPDGPTHMWDNGAFIDLEHRGSASTNLLAEYHWDAAVTWFGDIALATTGDGGVVYFWSQERERFGLFARRFTPAGEVTDVEPIAEPGVLALRGLRYVAGSGVRARVALTGGPARLDLFDLAGRRVAGERFGPDARGEREVTLSGTASLHAGLFFARLTARDGARLGRVIVTR